jgi:hypothetical protein
MYVWQLSFLEFEFNLIYCANFEVQLCEIKFKKN